MHIVEKLIENPSSVLYLDTEFKMHITQHSDVEYILWKATIDMILPYFKAIYTHTHIYIFIYPTVSEIG